MMWNNIEGVLASITKSTIIYGKRNQYLIYFSQLQVVIANFEWKQILLKIQNEQIKLKDTKTVKTFKVFRFIAHKMLST